MRKKTIVRVMRKKMSLNISSSKLGAHARVDIFPFSEIKIDIETNKCESSIRPLPF